MSRQPHEQGARNAEIAALVASGSLTLDEIGKHYGLTRERIRQLAAKRGVKTRTTGGADPLAIVRAIRSTRCVNFTTAAREAGTSVSTAREAVAALGLTVAVRRLFQWRKSAALRAKERRLVYAYHRESERLGRPLTSDEMQRLSPKPQRVYGRHYIARLRAAVGEGVHANAVRYVRRGVMAPTILFLAASPDGCTVPAVLSRVPTTAASVSRTINALMKAGRIYNATGTRGWAGHSTYRIVQHPAAVSPEAPHA